MFPRWPPPLDRDHMEQGGHGGILLWRGMPTWLLSASQWIRCLTYLQGKYDEYSEEFWWCAYECAYRYILDLCPRLAHEVPRSRSVRRVLPENLPNEEQRHRLGGHRRPFMGEQPGKRLRIQIRFCRVYA